jgi:hypothetical protein
MMMMMMMGGGGGGGKRERERERDAEGRRDMSTKPQAAARAGGQAIETKRVEHSPLAYRRAVHVPPCYLAHAPIQLD